MSCASLGRAGETNSHRGWGLPRQRLLSVHVAFLSMDILEFGLSCSRRGSSAPWLSTRSRHSGESPAMLPRAHTACSRTSSLGESRSCTKIGTEPCVITSRVCSDVPEAMLVRAHAASNWRAGLSGTCRSCTNRGTTPAPITSSMGGDLSIDRSLRNWVTAWSCSAGSSELMEATSCSGLAPCQAWRPRLPKFSECATAVGAPPPKRFFCKFSARFSLRMEMVVSSRLRRASSLSSVL
mmetsp:Transcript_5148/g.14164  ORF Transcript_5148/g.14164 Transcript_5148/m.14164 type:complete len:238 (-) Transcript_5148:218-931(-)